MPELPEVETSCRGIAPHLVGQGIARLIVRQPKLRWLVPSRLGRDVKGQVIQSVWRRGKYIIIALKHGHMLLHLGMSGCLRILPSSIAPQKHDHIDMVLASGKVLRFNDPRRFGCWLWTTENIEQHALLRKLGPEPLSRSFNSRYLYQRCKTRKSPIKSLIMNSHIVAGVGNIYANEALFTAGIHPQQSANTITLSQIRALTKAIKAILRQAIKSGGTTLRDFQNSDGKPGYFYQKLKVYGRGGQPCLNCNSILITIKLNQRQTVYCPRCQKGEQVIPAEAGI